MHKFPDLAWMRDNKIAPRSFIEKFAVHYSSLETHVLAPGFQSVPVDAGEDLVPFPFPCFNKRAK
jgi:hypothetical protein